MAEPLRPDWNATERAALDRYTVASPRAGLGDAIVAAALASPTGEPVAPRPSRDRRGSWRRSSRIAFGVMALGLMSATAAASGWFGEAGTRLPVISVIATVIPDEIKATPKAVPKPALARVERPAPVAEAPPPAAVDPAAAAHAQAILARADRIETMLDRHDQRRKDAGMPSDTARVRERLAALRAAQSDDERAAVMQQIAAERSRWRERQMARRMAGPGDPVRTLPPAAAEARARRAMQPLCSDAEAATPWRNNCRPSREQQIARWQQRCATVPPGMAVPRFCTRAMHGPRAGAPPVELAPEETGEAIAQ